jgi:hypothetical protein
MSFLLLPTNAHKNPHHESKNTINNMTVPTKVTHIIPIPITFHCSTSLGGVVDALSMIVGAGGRDSAGVVAKAKVLIEGLDVADPDECGSSVSSCVTVANKSIDMLGVPTVVIDGV